MSIKKLIVFFLIIFFISLHSCRKTIYNCGSKNITFKDDIKPLYDTKCSPCHTGDYTFLKKKADDGRLKKRTIVKKDMPPNGKLSFSERQLIFCWINDGAPNN